MTPFSFGFLERASNRPPSPKISQLENVPLPACGAPLSPAGGPEADHSVLLREQLHSRRYLPCDYSFLYSASGMGKVRLFRTAPRIGTFAASKLSFAIRAGSRRVEFEPTTKTTPSVN